MATFHAIPSYRMRIRLASDPMHTFALFRRGFRRVDPPPPVVLAVSLLSVSCAARAAALPTVDGEEDPRRTDDAEALSDPCACPQSSTWANRIEHART
jgi:hypothetical protein